MNRVLWGNCRLCGLPVLVSGLTIQQRVKMKGAFAREHKFQWFRHSEFAGMPEYPRTEDIAWMGTTGQESGEGTGLPRKHSGS